jgi:hypothetical protein
MEKPDILRSLRRPVGPALAALGVAALLAFASVQNRALAERRRTGGAGIAPRPSEPPPALAFVVVGLGAFRGLAAEALWLRADRLQWEGRYFELVQLSNWITSLDPYAADAWAYNAWNLAYNISAMMLRPEDRVRWVWHGLRLLRDDALAWNPGDAQLCRELAWLYLNKIGGDLDEAAPDYRRFLAAEAAPLFGPDGAFPAAGPARDAVCGAFKLDASRVAAIEAQTGPLDWRTAASHALYWAWSGMETAPDPSERFKCRRLACHALMALYGRDPALSDAVSPNPAVLPALLDLLAKQYAASPSSTTRRLYGFHLLHALRSAAAAGDTAGRDRYYEALRRIAAHGYSLPPVDALLQPEVPLDDFLAPLRQRPAPGHTP